MACLTLLASSCLTCNFTKIGQPCTRTYAGVSRENLAGDCGEPLVCAIEASCRGECKGQCRKSCNGVDGCPGLCTCTFSLATENGGAVACEGDGC
jgi:hypothetical protein